MARSVRAFLGRVLAALLVAAAFAASCPPRASAVSFSAPADVLDKVDVSASTIASDGPGLLLLYVDGSLARSVPVTRSPAAVAFTGVPLTAGSHHLRLMSRTSSGLLAAAARDIVSWRKPVPPVLVTPKGGYAAARTAIIAKAGPGTTQLRLLLNGKAISAKNAQPGQVVGMGTVTLAAGINTIVIEASNPVSKTSGTFKVRRLDFPWPTCIVIDKSEYKLYWVKDGVLVKTYPVAIGKSWTPTPERNWRVGEKYVYEYWGIYGPRRLRLYKQVGSRFYYTAYGVHGTNQEWVIGTMASHGCIRMYNKDILDLYPQVPLYTMVQTRE